MTRSHPRVVPRRLAGLLPLIAALVLMLTTGRAEAQPAAFAGDFPAPGQFSLVSWSGGSLQQLEQDAEAAGCDPRGVWANGPGGVLAPYLFGAPAFVNAGFQAIYPSGLAGGQPFILACHPAAPPPTARFETLPPGSALPSGAQCASRVRSVAEIRPANAGYNATRGTSPHDSIPRVDGDFTGTTDELIQWAACKWGIDEDVARAQVAIESWWRQSTRGDLTNEPAICHPDLRDTFPCPESIGLMQVRYQYHGEAYEDANAIRSSAYNLDYAFAMWRSCFEGDLTWLNTVERGRDYEAGDLWGCTGVWFSGRWYTQPAIDYNARVQDYLNQRIWETGPFQNP